MTRMMIAAALGASLISLVAFAPNANAQVSSNDEFSSQGGPAGCYDPNRVTPRQRDSLVRMGSQPCPARRADAAPPRAVSGSWYGNSEGAAIDDGTGLGLTFGVLCERGGLSLSLISARPQADRLLTGLRTVPVTITGRTGTVTLTLARDAAGDLATAIGTNQLDTLRGASVITVTTPRWTARFSGTGATRALASVRCPGARASVGPAPTSAVSTRSWLVGAWAYQDQYCASSGPIVIKDDGTYFVGDDVFGRWSVTGDTLTLTPRGKRGGVSRISRVGPNDLRLDNAAFKRCPANGGAEPWHPGARF